MPDIVLFFFFKQKTAYEMRISDWSSDVCSSDLHGIPFFRRDVGQGRIVALGRVVDQDIEPGVFLECRPHRGLRELRVRYVSAESGDTRLRLVLDRKSVV